MHSLRRNSFPRGTIFSCPHSVRRLRERNAKERFGFRDWVARVSETFLISWMRTPPLETLSGSCNFHNETKTMAQSVLPRFDRLQLMGAWWIRSSATRISRGNNAVTRDWKLRIVVAIASKLALKSFHLQQRLQRDSAFFVRECQAICINLCKKGQLE